MIWGRQNFSLLLMKKVFFLDNLFFQTFLYCHVCGKKIKWNGTSGIIGKKALNIVLFRVSDSCKCATSPVRSSAVRFRHCAIFGLFNAKMRNLPQLLASFFKFFVAFLPILFSQNFWTEILVGQKIVFRKFGFVPSHKCFCNKIFCPPHLSSFTSKNSI